MKLLRANKTLSPGNSLVIQGKTYTWGAEAYGKLVATAKLSDLERWQERGWQPTRVEIDGWETSHCVLSTRAVIGALVKKNVIVIVMREAPEDTAYVLGPWVPVRILNGEYTEWLFAKVYADG